MTSITPNSKSVGNASQTTSERVRIMQRQPRRISITISHQVYQTLLNRSEEEGRSMSNLCAFLLEEVLHQQAPAPAHSQAYAQPPSTSERSQPQHSHSMPVGVSATNGAYA